MRQVSTAERRARLAIRHRLVPGERTDDVAAIAESLVALHSTDPVTVYLSAAARMRHPSIAAVERALYDERTVIRHHAMRRTLWVTTPGIARLAHAATTKALQEPERRRTIAMLEANHVAADAEAWLEAAERDTLAALARRGEATARQLGEDVPALRAPLRLAEGKSYAATQGAHIRVLLLLGFQGRIVRTRPTGSWINSQYRYAAIDSWLPGGLAGLDARPAAAELAHRWLQRFGPASTADLQWWMGWTVATTKQALTDCAAVAVDVDGAPGWLAGGDDDNEAAPEPWVALLPALDPTTMGWKQRDWYLDPAYAAVLFDRNGNGGPTLWADGRIVGGWAPRPNGEIAYRLLADVGREHTRRIAAAAADLEALLGGTRFSVRFAPPLQKELLA